MFTESLVNILFRLINFGALIGLMVYAFKRYFLKDITEKIDQETAEKQSLANQINQLEQQGKIIAEEINQQEQLCKQLSDRVKSWHKAFNEETEKTRKEHHDLYLKSIERMETQKKFILHEQVMKEIVPPAIEQLKATLIQDFSVAEHNQAFVTDVIDHFKKSS